MQKQISKIERVAFPELHNSYRSRLRHFMLLISFVKISITTRVKMEVDYFPHHSLPFDRSLGSQ